MVNVQFGDNGHLIYTNMLEIKDTTDTPKSTSYIHLHSSNLELDNRGRLHINLYDFNSLIGHVFFGARVHYSNFLDNAKSLTRTAQRGI